MCLDLGALIIRDRIQTIPFIRVIPKAYRGSLIEDV